MSNFQINPQVPHKYIKSFMEDGIFFSLQPDLAYVTSDILMTEYIINNDNSILPYEDISEERFMLY